MIAEYVFRAHITLRSPKYFKNWPCCTRNCCNAKNLKARADKDNQDALKKREDKDFVTRLKQRGYYYLIDASSADIIASHISRNWTEGYIIEANPGLGILTKAILNTGVPHLRVFEKNCEFLSVLQALLSEYSNLEVIDMDFFSLPSVELRTTHKGNADMKRFLGGIPRYPWNNGVPLRVFCIISSNKSFQFLRYLLVSLCKRTAVFSHGRCEFYLLVTESEYMYMKAAPKRNYSTYRWLTILYDLFFDIECIDKFTSELFFPLPIKIGRRMYEESHFYFVKLSPKPDIFSSLINGNQIKEFYYFVRHHFGKRTSFVLPAMEKLVPSCGPRLIKEGMDVFTNFGDLNSEQLIRLFNQFSSWPEYESSTFHKAVDEFVKKRSDSYKDI